MIKVVKGNMFKSDAGALVNPVNCKGVMGAGLALEFKSKYPKMYSIYRTECKFGTIKLGKIWVWKSPTGLLIINFPTKDHWEDKSTEDGIIRGLYSLRDFLWDYRDLKVAVPALGCGLGGLEWEVLRDNVYKILRNIRAEIELYEPF